VKNLSAEKAKVTWGEQSKDFTKEQLEKGINLAAEFEQTPFDAAFKKFVSAVGSKQAFETGMIKDFVTKFRSYAADMKMDPELGAALNTVKTRLGIRHSVLEAESRKSLQPVRHALTVTQ
jgi:hypothetical protein